ncbi:MAG TPA: glycosyltransferase family 4 protein [Bacteroidales bacterium]|nr:glycosyltransferase family 4 protein [Bacteroidales bacterium]HPO64330.1 glycosyltransferase family 4 protein [Bacteroidales bacterium]
MEKVSKIAVIGNFLPRKCGIATFTTDLTHAFKQYNPKLECHVIAMNDNPTGYAYPANVKFEIYQNNRDDYHQAAEYLNYHNFEVVSLQHEYGIFGGECGEYIIHLLEELKLPVVTTLHTVLSQPSTKQYEVLKKICDISARVVVMAEKGKEFLTSIYGIPENKIKLIHHGIPEFPFIDPYFYKEKLQFSGRRVILTFGLISSNKGIEYMLQAMPQIIAHHPDVMYVVLGATHPHVIAHEGDRYRKQLESLVSDLRLENYVRFVNRFVSQEELHEYLSATDIYVTPYLSENQITSGTLSYALGLGKAVVSTPYYHAKEILSEGRGILVNFRDEKSLSQAIIRLLNDSEERNAIRKRAYLFSQQFCTWPKVAALYLDLFDEIKSNKLRSRYIFNEIKLEKRGEISLPELNIDHLVALTDETGLLQHAKYHIPHREHGYCVDDNSRALLLTVLLETLFGMNHHIKRLQDIYLSFIYHSYNVNNGWFRNLMSYSRNWIEEIGSEDSHARVLWSLGVATAFTRDENIFLIGIELFRNGLKKVYEIHHPRSLAYAILGMQAYLWRFSGDLEIKRMRDYALEKLMDHFKHQNDPAWPWYEDKVSYASVRIPHAMIHAGFTSHNEAVMQRGLDILSWLIEVQTHKGKFAPIGNKGWFFKGKEKPAYDQQPIEAAAMVDACLTAFFTTGDRKFYEAADRAFRWFLGENDLGICMYDPKTHGCYDGLMSDNVNRNMGAESTLSWLYALTLMHAVQKHKNEIFYIDANQFQKNNVLLNL